MNALTQLERWTHASLPGYRAQLKVFQEANERVIRAADKEDLDAAAEGFTQLTMSCVNCHKIVRDAKRPAEAR
jgi:cytochrome c556